MRDSSLVFLAGITGVPWQDIATDNTLTDPKALKYKTADQLAAGGVWDDILGDVNKYVKPKDPLMEESIDPRTGSNPITNDALAPPGANANTNPINGHEYDIPGRDDLQYACIFPLGTPRQNGQDCGNYGQQDVSPNKPLCQNPADNSYGTTQYFAKAYPGLRQLQVLKDYGSNSIVASICPKVTTGSDTDPSFGYNPAVGAIIERLKEVLGGKCLPRKLQPVTDTKSPTYGQVPCEVVEALPAGSPNAYDCTKKPGRSPLTGDNGAKLEAAVRSRLKQDGQCDGTGQPACADFKMCQIDQLGPQTGQAELPERRPGQGGCQRLLLRRPELRRRQDLQRQVHQPVPRDGEAPAALRRGRHEDADRRRQRVHRLRRRDVRDGILRRKRRPRQGRPPMACRPAAFCAWA